MDVMELVKNAEELMIDAHHNRTLSAKVNEKGWQVDKAGVDYIHHPLTVASFVQDPKEKIVALLHDTLEDTAVTEGELRGLGFGEDIIAALKLVTHESDPFYADPHEEYRAYIRRLKASGNTIAIHVKIADLTHNTDLRRVGGKKTPKYEDYLWAIDYLKDGK